MVPGKHNHKSHEELSGRVSRLYKCIFEVMVTHVETCSDIPIRQQGPESPRWERDVGKRLKIKLLRRPWYKLSAFR